MARETRRSALFGDGTDWKERAKLCYESFLACNGIDVLRRAWLDAALACQLRASCFDAQEDPWFEELSKGGDVRVHAWMVRGMAEALEESREERFRSFIQEKWDWAYQVTKEADAYSTCRKDAALAWTAWMRSGLMEEEALKRSDPYTMHPIVVRAWHTLEKRTTDEESIAPGWDMESKETMAMECIESFLDSLPPGFEERILSNLSNLVRVAEEEGSRCAARICVLAASRTFESLRKDRKRREILTRMIVLPPGDGDVEPPGAEALEEWIRWAENEAQETGARGDETSEEVKEFLDRILPKLVLPCRETSMPSRKGVLCLRQHARDALQASFRVLGVGAYLETVKARMENGRGVAWSPWQSAEVRLLACSSVLDAWPEDTDGSKDAGQGGMSRPSAVVEECLPIVEGSVGVDKEALSLARASAASCIANDALWILDTRTPPLAPWLEAAWNAWSTDTDPSIKVEGGRALHELCSAAACKVSDVGLPSSELEAMMRAADAMVGLGQQGKGNEDAEGHLAAVLVWVVDAVRSGISVQQAHGVASHLAERALQGLEEALGQALHGDAFECIAYAERICMRAGCLASAHDWEPSWDPEDCSCSISGLVGSAMCSIWTRTAESVFDSHRPSRSTSWDDLEQIYAKTAAAAILSAPSCWSSMVVEVAGIAASFFPRSPEAASAMLASLAGIGYAEAIRALEGSSVVEALHQRGYADQSPHVAHAFFNLAAKCLLDRPWDNHASWEQALTWVFEASFLAASAHHPGAARAALQFITTILDRAAREDNDTVLVPVVLSHGERVLQAVVDTLHGGLSMQRIGKCAASLECLALVAGRCGDVSLPKSWCASLPLAKGGAAVELAQWMCKAGEQERIRPTKIICSTHMKQLRRICRMLVMEGRKREW